MCKILLTLAAVLWCGVSVARADDVAAVRQAFDLFVQYQKTDDEHSLDLFAEDVSVTLTFDTGKETRDMNLPSDKFRELLSQEIAKKHGNPDTYEDVKLAQEGDTVKVTSTLLYSASGKREPFVAIYAKDASGHFKVKALKVTVPVDKLPAGR